MKSLQHVSRTTLYTYFHWFSTMPASLDSMEHTIDTAINKTGLTRNLTLPSKAAAGAVLLTCNPVAYTHC